MIEKLSLSCEKIGIVGKGFALYGYLPAIARLNAKIVLCEQQREFLLERKELQKFVGSVIWVDSYEDIIKKSDILVIALQPQRQYDLVMAMITENKYTHIQHIFLEKPMAANPKQSQELLEILVKYNISFSVAYIFLYLPWYKELPKLLDRDDVHEITIEWAFLVYHHQHNLINWKSNPDEGGGVLSFYAIHVIALFSHLGMNNIHVLSEDYDNDNIVFSAEYQEKTIKFKVCLISEIRCFSIEYRTKEGASVCLVKQDDIFDSVKEPETKFAPQNAILQDATRCHSTRR